MKPGQRADVRDAVAHLSGADHTDLVDRMPGPGGQSAARLRALLHFDHLRLPSLVHTTSRSTTAFVELLGQLRQGLIEVRHQSIVGNLKDRCFLVLIDRNNDFRILHTREMLNST